MSIPELWTLFERTTDDSVKVNTLRYLATKYTNVNPDSAVNLAQSALEDAQALQLIWVEAHAYTSLGEAYDVSGKLVPSLENFEKAFTIFKQLKDTSGLGRAHNSRGLAYHYTGGDTKKALADLLIAKDIFEKEKDPAKLARNYHNLGIIYSTLNETYPALRYYLRARNMKDSLVNHGSTEINAQTQLSTYINLGAFYTNLNQFELARESLNKALDIASDDQLVRQMTIYYNLGTIEEQDSNFAEADTLYRESLELALQGNMIPRQPYIYDALGNVARKQRSLEQAGPLYQQAFLILKDFNMPDIRSGLLIHEGKLFFDQGNLINAKKSGEAGLLIAEENDFWEQRIEGYDLLARTAERQGNYTEAAHYLRQYIDLKEITDNEGKKQELLGLQAVMDVELEQERNKLAIELLKRKNAQKWIKGLSIILILISVMTIALALARQSLIKVNRQLLIRDTLLSEKTVGLATSEQQLKIANNKLKQFAFATSHDLKEALRNITSFTQLASIAMAESIRDAQSHLKQAAAGGKRMRKLLDDLLHYSNLGGNDTVKAAFPLQEAVSSVKEQLKEDILKSRGDVQLTTPANLKASRNEIEQLFFNLIHNSLRYSRTGVPPRIQIKLEKQDNEVIFRVKDNGMGIPKNEHATIFKPFHRLHNRMKSGSGLGLAICQKVIESYGGKIWYEAVPEGGSVFCFTLPDAQPRGQF